MFDRVGQDSSIRSSKGGRARSKAGRRLQVELLEGRALLTASLAPIPSVTVAATAGYQVPLNGNFGGNTDPETYTVSTDNATGGVAASIATGEFWTIGVNHVSSGANDPAFSGTMTFQLFKDLTPNSVAKIESLITGTVPFNQLTAAAQAVIYPGGSGSTGMDYYTVGGNTFHRIANMFPGVNDYIVQGGSINHDGTGQVFATPYQNENLPQLVFNGTGQLALANSGGTDSNDSQFFVTTGSPQSLNGNYTIFGQLVAGQNVLAEMTKVAVGGTSGTTPLGAVDITSSTLSTTNPNGVVHINAASATTGTQTNVTVTATDTVDHSQVSRTFPVLTIPSGTPTSATTTPPSLNTVATPISTAANTPTTFQLTATNPTGGTLSYTVQGGLTSGAFTSLPATTGTATVSSTGLVTVTPAAGYTGPINLVVGVEDQTDRTGSGNLSAPANYSLQNVTVNVGSFPKAPTINPVATPITASVSQTVQIQLSATNPTGGQLTYTVQGGLTNGAFTPVTNATASVDANGLVTVVPNAAYTGPIDLLVGVRDQINRAGTGQPIDSPTNYSTENIVINVVQPVGTGAVRFILDSPTSATGNLVITPVARPSLKANNTIDVTQNNGNVEVIVNGSIDLNQPAISDVDSIIVYGSKANDRITIDPSLTVPVTLNGGTGGHNVLVAASGPTREQGWYGTNVEKQGASNNYLFGRKGHVTFVKGSGTSDVIFAGTIYHPRGHSRIRRIPPPLRTSFFAFSGTKLISAPNPFNPPKPAKKK
jgi:cyclophilin family peptidyl-prolyl cis-trans isomerase